MRPTAYLTIQDMAARVRIMGILERRGWTIVSQPTGFHLIRALADVIEGHQRWGQPAMIVIDAWSRGCAGTTIAAGLRELGITIPIVLIDPHDTAKAEQLVAELAERLIRLDDAA